MDDDGTSVEPDYYCPIIPMVLVNGGKGIGTGFSYEGLSYNTLEIIDWLMFRLKNKFKGKYQELILIMKVLKAILFKLKMIMFVNI